MKISRDWLGDYVDLGSLSDDEIAARLTEIGHAVESTERHGQDVLFDIEFTSNRVDAMSHLGLARDLSAALGRELRPPTPSIGPVRDSGEVNISIEAPELCSRYTGLIVKGVKVGPSDAKVQRRLEGAGLRPINNLVDATNYVMLAMGHPLHAFDLKDISGKAVRVRAAQPGEKMRTLDGVDRTLDREMCVIADASRPVALGGVIGGQNSEVRDTTRDILLECAHFAPGSVRRTARRLGIRTDASYRFERGVDPADTILAITTAADLIIRQAGGTRGDLIDVVAGKAEQHSITLREARLLEASAGMISLAWVLELFRRLGFNATGVAGGIQVTVPTYRGDLIEEDDLIEEALRFFGYNRIPAALPRVTTGDVRTDVITTVEDEVRDLLAGCGLSEAITYSFVPPEWNVPFSTESPIVISNALTENISAMRLSLIPGLLEAVSHNRSYGIRDGGLFEVGRTYHQRNEGVQERHVAALVVFGSNSAHWGDSRRPADFFDVKGFVEAVARSYHVELSFAPLSLPWMKEGQAAVARAGVNDVAVAGFLTRELLQRFDIKGEVIAAEIDLQRLLGSVEEWKMKPVSRYPGVAKVVTFFHAPDLQYGEVIERVRALKVPYLQEIGIRDRFVPEGSEEVKTVLGMWYQASDKSLTEEEVAALNQDVAARLGQMLPVRVTTS